MNELLYCLMLMVESIRDIDFEKYWYVFHSIGFHYPIHPNKVSKKKYYDLVMNIPIFLPSERLGNHFSKLLDKYPVTPYLDSRESFIKWTHFIHNRMNEQLGLKSLSYADFVNKYRQPLEKEPKKRHWLVNDYKNIVIVGLLSIIIWIIYNKLSV